MAAKAEKNSSSKMQKVIAGIVIGLGLGLYGLYELGIFQKFKDSPSNPPSHERIVAGVILDTTTNDPVAGVKVYPEEESTDIFVTTNQGDFRLPISGDFKGDTLTLHAMKDGYASARQQARVPSSHNPILLATFRCEMRVPRSHSKLVERTGPNLPGGLALKPPRWLHPSLRLATEPGDDRD